MEHDPGSSTGGMEILRPCPARAQDFWFPSAPGKTQRYFTGRDLIPAFPSFKGTDRCLRYGGGTCHSNAFGLPFRKASAGFVTGFLGLQQLQGWRFQVESMTVKRWLDQPLSNLN